MDKPNIWKGILCFYHALWGCSGLLLVAITPSQSSTKYFFDLVDFCHSCCFVKTRPEHNLAQKIKKHMMHSIWSMKFDILRCQSGTLGRPSEFWTLTQKLGATSVILSSSSKMAAPWTNMCKNLVLINNLVLCCVMKSITSTVLCNLYSWPCSVAFTHKLSRSSLLLPGIS